MSAHKTNIGKCIVEGCVRSQKSLHMCGLHYDRQHRCGNAGPAERMNTYGLSLEEKMLSHRKIVQHPHMDTPCWEWQGQLNPNGYGRYGAFINGRQGTFNCNRLAAYVWSGFDLASPLFILHHCDNPPCFNPAHLYPGTDADNKKDMYERGRGCFGEKHPLSKLTDTEVRGIRRERKEGVSSRKLAKKYRVSRTVIMHVCKRRTWKHVE